MPTPPKKPDTEAGPLTEDQVKMIVEEAHKALLDKVTTTVTREVNLATSKLGPSPRLLARLDAVERDLQAVSEGLRQLRLKLKHMI